MTTGDAGFPRACRVTGIGISEVGREVARSPLALTLDACLAAVADAGVDVGEIDGVATYPGGRPDVTAVREALGLDLRWSAAIHEGVHTSPLFDACMAVQLGVVRHALVFRTVDMLAGLGRDLVAADEPGFMDWQRPFGSLAATNWFAMRATRFLHQRGLRRTDVGRLAIVSRANATLNPHAVFRRPLSMDEYLDARMISTPLGLYDCDAPCTGSLAFVVSRRPGHGDLGRAPRVEAFVAPSTGRSTVDQYDRMMLWAAGEQLWRSTRVRPADVDVAQVYDGFSTLALEWLEALRLCAEGDVVSLLRDGEGIGRSGRMPTNTGGGMLSGGRLHGYLQLWEACVQLRGDGGLRQVQPQPRIAAIGVGGAGIGSAMLLVNDEA